MMCLILRKMEAIRSIGRLKSGLQQALSTRIIYTDNNPTAQQFFFFANTRYAARLRPRDVLNLTLPEAFPTGIEAYFQNAIFVNHLIIFPTQSYETNSAVDPLGRILPAHVKDHCLLSLHVVGASQQPVESLGQLRSGNKVTKTTYDLVT